ncbi:MAG: hypothetical protein U0L19_06805 [Bacteroidales bacterium]|nr:hypothetical protein [Bacteroidales bacterium]
MHRNDASHPKNINRIRIIGGKLHGIKGRLLSRQGSKVKRLFVELTECNLAVLYQ